MTFGRMTSIGLAAAACVSVGGCAGPSLSGGVSLPPGASATIDVLGAAKVSVANGGAQPLAYEMSAGALAGERGVIEPGVTRWWNPDGPRRLVVRNAGDATIPWSYAVEGASASFVRSDVPVRR